MASVGLPPVELPLPGVDESSVDNSSRGLGDAWDEALELAVAFGGIRGICRVGNAPFQGFRGFLHLVLCICIRVG